MYDTGMGKPRQLKNRVTVECVSVLSSLGDYGDMIRNLASHGPGDVMKAGPGAVYGRIDDSRLADPGRPCRRTRAERIVATLIDQQREAIDRCLAGVDSRRIAVILGTTAGGMAEAESTRAPGHRFTQDYDFRYQRLGQVARFAADQLGAEGLVTGVSTACTSGARAIGLGMRWLALDWCDVAVVGGVDAECGMTSLGFASLEAVSAGFCRPFDAARDGINLGEGGALLVLRRVGGDHEGGVAITGYGESLDAWHVSAPHPEGRGIARAMNTALLMSGYTPRDVGYVNMHGTATQQNDAMEASAIIKVLGPEVPVSSTKTMTGHTLGAAGAIEAVICCALLRGDLASLPVQHGLESRDPHFDALAIVTETGRILEKSVVMSNSCGFGGHNTALVISR